MTNLGESWNYMTVRGDQKCTISTFGARMRNYRSENPFTIENPKAIIQAFGCTDKMEEPFNMFPDKKQ